MNDRTQALSRLPPQLFEGDAARWAVVQRTEGVDQTSMTLLHASGDAGELCLELQEWFFDEEQLSWVQETRVETWLERDTAARLGGLLTELTR